MIHDLMRRFEEWQPNADEATCPGNAWFYRAFDCLRAEWPTEAKKWNGLFHNAICWSRGDPVLTLKTITRMIDAMPAPLEPWQSYCSDYEPQPEEGAPFEIFKQQFKERWPGKRLNSKFAKDKWLEVQDKAKEIYQENFQQKHDNWKEREARRAAGHQVKIAEWQAKADNLKQLQEFARRLTACIESTKEEKKNEGIELKELLPVVHLSGTA